MRHLQMIALSMLLLILLTVKAQATCAGSMGTGNENYPSGTACVNPIWSKAILWFPQFADGRKKTIQVIDKGVSNNNVTPCVGCWPAFSQAICSSSERRSMMPSVHRLAGGHGT